MSRVKDYFAENPYAQNLGQAVEGVAGLAGMYMNISDTVKQQRETSYDIPLMESNPYERPSYDLGGAINQHSNWDTSEAGKGLVGQSIGAGAASGAAIGSFFPGLGSVIGAGAGALVGGISGWIGKEKAEREAEDQKAKQGRLLANAQSNYNTEATAYDQNMDARERYHKRLMDRRRKIQRVIG